MSDEFISGFRIINRADEKVLAFVAAPKVLRASIEGKIVGTKREIWLIQIGGGAVPAEVAYLDPLPLGWPKECGKAT